MGDTPDKITPSDQITSGLLDKFSKSTVIAVLAIYVFGFVIVSIHNAQYGLVELSPWKSKVLAAGTLFLIMTIFPAIVAERRLLLTSSATGAARYAMATIRAQDYLLYCNSAALALGALYSVSSRQIPTLRLWDALGGWRRLAVLGGVLSVIVLMGALKSYLLKRCDAHPARVIGLGVALLAAFVILVGFLDQNLATIEIWLFVVGTFVFLERELTKSPRQTWYDWVGLIFPVVGCLSVFAGAVYPKIQPAWGGGRLTTVAVYFSAQSSILPAQTLQAELIDESDSGIYILRSGERHAIYVPRTAIAAMYFSDSTSAGVLLRSQTTSPPQDSALSNKYEIIERSQKSVANYGKAGTHTEVDYVLLHEGHRIYASCDLETVNNLDPKATCGFRPLHVYECDVESDSLAKAKMPMSDLRCKDADGNNVYLYVSKKD